MKKKYWLLVLAVVLLVSVSACGNKEAQTPVDNVSATDSAAKSGKSLKGEKEQGKTLVAVFSRVNNSKMKNDVDVTSGASLNKSDGGIKGDTQMMAEVAKDATGGTIFEIVAKEPYPTDEEKVYERAKEEQLNQERPALTQTVKNMDDYSTIILVYPNWWGSIPMPVATFLESYDLSRKTILPVCCYDAEDDRSGTSRKDIQELCKGYVTNVYSVRGSGGSTPGTRTDFTAWLQKMPVNY